MASESEKGTCVDPAYVRYLERQLDEASRASESARTTLGVVGSHNAELTDEVEVLRSEVRRLERVRADCLSENLRLTNEALARLEESTRLQQQIERLTRERTQLADHVDTLTEENALLRKPRDERADEPPEGSA